jgi:Lon protease-like protein
MQSYAQEVINDLAIFPLATVLFPGAILPLHIFEDRYKQMMQYAVENEKLFGLSYRSDAEIGRETLPEPGSVGCLAKIHVVMPLDEGQLNLISSGVIRYRILELNQILPFLLARVETFTDDPEPDGDASELMDEIADTCKEFLDAAQMLDETMPGINQDLPEDPEAFSLLVSSALPIENDAKQALLEMTSTKLRLNRLKHYVTAALSTYSERIKIQELAKKNGHGRIGRQ